MQFKNGPQIVLPPAPMAQPFGQMQPTQGLQTVPPNGGQMAGSLPGQPAPGNSPPGGGQPMQFPGQAPQPQQAQQPQMPYQIGPMGLPPRTPMGPPQGIPALPPAPQQGRPM